MNRYALKTAILAAAMLLAAGCSDKNTAPDPFREAVTARIIESAGRDMKVSFYSFEKVDSTTFGTELEHRKTAFNKKLAIDQERYEQFLKERKPKNTQKKKADVETDLRFLEGLDRIGEEIADRLDEVAYYDFHFNGKARSPEGDIEFEDWWASISPEGEVLCMLQGKKGLHNALGRVLPGYLDLVGEEGTEDLEDNDKN